MRRMGHILAVCLLFVCTACFHKDPWPVPGPVEEYDYDNVLIFYAAGYFPGSSDLTSFIRPNIEDLTKGYVPEKQSREALVMLTHFTSRGREENPYMIRVYSEKGTVVCDTLKTYPLGTTLASCENMSMLLNEVKEAFTSSHYGMIFSSHGSGWTPVGYYYRPEDYEKTRTLKAAGRVQSLPHGAVPHYAIPSRPGGMVTKSLGIESASVDGRSVNYEMDIEEFASSIPMHLDYLVLDACYMGCVEVAYALREAVDYIVFSQTEIVGDGMYYPTMAYNLFDHSRQGLVGSLKDVCHEFYVKYAEDDQEWRRTCLVSLVDCSGLEALAEVTGDLISKYRDGIDKAGSYPVQRFYCYDSKPFFFDFEDIFVAAGASPEDLRALAAAEEACVLFKENTEGVLGDFLVDTFSGLSMFLPCHGTKYLNDYYRNLSWNQAVGLVQ